MRGFWVYDWEVFPNYSCVTFIHTSTPKSYVDTYIIIDKLYLEVKHKLLDIEKSSISEYLSNDEYLSLSNKLNSYIKAKQECLSLMNYKSFFFYKDKTNEDNNICNLGELLLFFENYKLIMGYNSFKYDSFITDFIMIQGKKFSNITGYDSKGVHITEALKKASDEVISVANNEFYNYTYSFIPKRYKRLFEDYDIQKILYLDKSFVGLKSIGINLLWHRLQPLPYPIEKTIEGNEKFEVYDYNINDVLITLSLVWNQEEEITLREEVSVRYNIDVTNDSRSSIGKRLMSKYYSEYTGLAYKDFKDLRTYRNRMKLSNIIDSRIKFITPELTEFLNSLLKETVSSDDEFNKPLMFKGTLYTIAKGGIHSVDDSRVYNSLKDGYIYRDADITSYYPSIIEVFKISPKHIDLETFVSIVSAIKNDRVRAKHAGDKLEAESLKIVINRIYGALRDTMDYLYDPKATYEVTLNGQLSLLMLIEKLEVKSEGNIHIISANTDGIVARFKPEFEELYNTLCKEWEKETQFELEYTNYEVYTRSNVNNYVSAKSGFTDNLSKYSRKDLEKKYVKSKGDYSSDIPFNKGFIHPIVSMALKEYVLYGTDYKEYIKTFWKQKPENILYYCISQKVDKKFDVKYTYVEDGYIKTEYLPQYNRFYVCSKGGGAISKCDVYKDKARNQSLIAKHSVLLLNDFIPKEEYNINYNFYIRKVEDYLYFKKSNSKGSHKSEGLLVRNRNLFNNEEF